MSLIIAYVCIGVR